MRRRKTVKIFDELRQEMNDMLKCYPCKAKATGLIDNAEETLEKLLDKIITQHEEALLDRASHIKTAVEFEHPLSAIRISRDGYASGMIESARTLDDLQEKLKEV
jgi:hypothetical protein